MDRRLAWLAVGTFAISTVGFAFAGLLPFIARDLAGTVTLAGFVVTAYSLAYAIGAPVLSAAAGTLDRRLLLCGAMLAFVAGNLAAAASPGFAALVAAHVLMGAAAGLYVSTAQAAAVALSGPDQRALAISVVFAGTTFAVALGAPLGSLIAGLWGWRGTFLAVGVLGIACAAVLWLRLPKGSRGTRLSLGERMAAINGPGVLPSLLVTVFNVGGGFCIVAYLGPLAFQGAGLPEIALPAMLLTFGVGAVIGNAASGYLSDRIGAARVVLIALLSAFPMCIAFTAIIEFAPRDLAGPLLIAIMLPWGVIGWTFPPAQASWLAGLAPAAAHLTLSLNVSALYIGIALGTAFGGRVLEIAEPGALPLASMIFPALALVSLAMAHRSTRRPRPAE